MAGSLKVLYAEGLHTVLWDSTQSLRELSREGEADVLLKSSYS